ncbi:hypothetical protein POTOM_008991 [Populus tomentosa]|uniref:Uncharacterized protein n=1 Tax=Populus tomentosa TaxID=118781 RepID=A0A8X8AIE1_POPTO|nr:hypothetical protein POTOM_008991 [Populus tomentosa]
MAYVTNKECRITLTPAIRIHKRLSPPTLSNLGCSRIQRDQKQECCTASGYGTLEAHGSCGGRVTGAEWQERCWIWIGGAAVIRLQEGLDRRWEWYVYGGCTVGALIWLKTKLSFQSWVHDSVHLPLQLVGVKVFELFYYRTKEKDLDPMGWVILNH